MRLAILGHARVIAVLRRSEALQRASTQNSQDTRLASRSRHASNQSSKDQQKQQGSAQQHGMACVKAAKYGLDLERAADLMQPSSFGCQIYAC